MITKMDVYNHLPVWGQNLACRIEGRHIKKLRYGDDFRRGFERVQHFLPETSGRRFAEVFEDVAKDHER